MMQAHHSTFPGEEEEGEGEEVGEEERSETSSIGACSSSESESELEEKKKSKSSNKSSLTSLECLEDALPFKRGLSNFYSGKSKSFTALSHAASSSSVKDLVKPDNSFNKRRRLQLLASLSRSRRASCTSLVSVSSSSSSLLHPPPHLLSECIREDEDASDASPERPSSSSSRLQRRRPSLFTVAVSASPPQPDPAPLLTPKPLLTTKLSVPRRPPARSFSLSDLSHHPHLH